LPTAKKFVAWESEEEREEYIDAQVEIRTRAYDAIEEKRAVAEKAKADAAEADRIEKEKLEKKPRKNSAWAA
jgi:hypothetical protein